MPGHPKESTSARYRRLAGECWEIAYTFPKSGSGYRKNKRRQRNSNSRSSPKTMTWARFARPSLQTSKKVGLPAVRLRIDRQTAKQVRAHKAGSQTRETYSRCGIGAAWRV